MMREKTCPICGSSFEGHGNRVYCSRKCAHEGNILLMHKRRMQGGYTEYQTAMKKLTEQAMLAVSALSDNQRWCLRELFRRGI